MKKLLLFVLIGAMFGLCLVGCAKKPGSEHPTKGATSEHPK